MVRGMKDEDMDGEVEIRKKRKSASAFELEEPPVIVCFRAPRHQGKQVDVN